MPLDEEISGDSTSAAATTTAATTDVEPQTTDIAGTSTAAADTTTAGTDTTTTAAADTTTTTAATADATDTTTAGTDTTTTAAAAPAFDEKAWLKATFGDDAAETAAEMQQRLADLRASQITPVQKGQLALLGDTAKLAQYADLTRANADLEKKPALDLMREKFGVDNAALQLTPAQLERRFNAQLKEKYPVLHGFMQNPDDYEATDPALVAEQEDLEIDARPVREALKAHYTTVTNEFIQNAAAPTVTANPDDVAAATAALQWYDDTVKPGYALPIDVGNGSVLKMPVTDPAAFKAAFVSPDQLYLRLVNGKTAEGKPQINAEMQAKVALFLSDPKGYDAFIANAAKASVGPSLAVTELTNSSTAAAAAAPAATTTTTASQPVRRAAWQDTNI